MESGDAVSIFHTGTHLTNLHLLTMTTSTLSISAVHEPNDHELKQINGGIIWK